MLKTIKGGTPPTRGSRHSACIDLYAREDVTISAGETVKVPLGICIDEEKLNKIIQNESLHHSYFMKSHYLQLEPRSSLRAKGIQAGTGIIDLDYQDEIMIILHNPLTMNEVYNGDHLEYFNIKKGDKIAQIMLCEHKSLLMGIDTDIERIGGFGSSGN
jgi:dUTPase